MIRKVLFIHNDTVSCFLCYRSGTEEQYGELQQLLDDACTSITDIQNRKAATKARKELQEELDRNNTEKFRDNAMLTVIESRYLTTRA